MTAHRAQDPVGRLVSRGAVTVRPEATLEEVAQVLDREGVGAVLVRSGEDVVGIVSERDIIRSMADPDFEADRADDVMTYRPETVDEHTSVIDVARMMIEGQVRHLPVVDDGGIFGVVSIRDVLAVLLEDR